VTLAEALQNLREAGTAQNRKIYARHGVGQNQFGVSFAHMRALAKKTKTDQALASPQRTFSARSSSGRQRGGRRRVAASCISRLIQRRLTSPAG